MAIALEQSHQHRHNNSSTQREPVVNCMAGLVDRISSWQRSLGCTLSSQGASETRHEAIAAFARSAQANFRSIREDQTCPRSRRYGP